MKIQKIAHIHQTIEAQIEVLHVRLIKSLYFWRFLQCWFLALESDYFWAKNQTPTTGVWFFAKNLWIKCEECAGALSFRRFSYNENSTIALNITSLKYCMQLTLLTRGKKWRMRMNVQGRLIQAHFIKILKDLAK